VNLRRTLALGTAGVAAIAALSACGFNYPTDRINNLTAGTDYRQGTVDILNAAIVAQQANSGTLVATFVNNSQSNTVALQSMSGDNTAVGQVTISKPVSIQPNGAVNLAGTQGIPVSGTFALGQFVTLSFQFDNGDTATVDVPVVADDGQWAGLDISTPSASPGATPSATPGGTPSAPSSTTPTPTDATS
jgi:hypothetical protein